MAIGGEEAAMKRYPRKGAVKVGASETLCIVGLWSQCMEAGPGGPVQR